MSTRRSALGRGLGALIPGPTHEAAGDVATPPAQAAAESQASASSPTRIPVASIDPNPEQPRRVFAAEQLASLRDSLLRHGVLQPVVVRRAGQRFELIVGERRWRAAKAAGLEEIPAVVSDVDSRDRLEIALVENVQRHDLNPVELAHAYRTLAESGHTQDEIGNRVGMDRSSVANHLRLLDLPRDVQEDIEQGRITMGHAKALLQVTHPERLRHLRDEIVSDQLSVREAERRGREVAGPAPARKRRAPRQTSPEQQQLIDQLRERFQTKIRIQGKPERGRIEIDYFGGEDLDRIVDLLIGG